MPLSENEQRLLEQMERALYAEDPKFASSMRGAARRATGGRLLIAGAALVVGLLLIVVGVFQRMVPVGVLGFLVMMGGTVYAMTGPRRTGPTGVVGGTAVRPGAGPAASRGGVRGGLAGPAGRGSAGGGRSPRSGGFMQRMEERWDRRKRGA